MADAESSKHKHRSDKDKSSKKRHKRADDERGHDRKRKRKDKDASAGGVRVVDDDADDDDMWVEKNIDNDGQQPVAVNIPSAETLKLTSRAEVIPGDPPLPPSMNQESKLSRDDWMLDPGESKLSAPLPVHDEGPAGAAAFTEGYADAPANQRTTGGGVDFFSGLGTERTRKPRPEAPDPDKVKISSMELNAQLLEGKNLDEYAAPAAPKATTPGGPGSQWRMMRLRRVFETAEEEGRPVEEIAVDRFGSLAAFEEAKEERRILDARDGRRADRDRGRQPPRPGPGSGANSGAGTPGSNVRYMFTDVGSGGSSRSASFRRPDVGGSSGGSATPNASGGRAPVMGGRAPGPVRVPSTLGTPVPSVMTPPAGLARVTTTTTARSKRALSPSSLNKLQAKVLRAKLMGAPDAGALEQEYENAMRGATGKGDDDDDDDEEHVTTKVEMLPTLDARGRLYDTGKGRDDDVRRMPGNRKKKEEQFETHDRKTGEVIRHNADDDTTTLGDMLRQERFGGGSADQKNMDSELARQIMTDSGFKNDLDYIDDNAEKLGRKKMRSDAMKRQFAINDYKRTQTALATCPFCYGEDDSLPKGPVVAMGTRAYLSRTINDELVDGHCLIVPIQHHLTMLEADDDVWDEIRNFMKCLMRMFAEEDKGVVFFETVISLKPQKHTFIECVPVPWEQYEELPAYFRESILQSELEWSQHKKLIDFGARPGGFRRAMVANLPYFMVQFDYKGERGYGHVIEGVGEADKEAEGDDIDEGEKGGGVFPRYFAGEIIGNVLDLEPRRWRRPKKIEFRQNRERVAEFKSKFDKFDWTPMLRQSA